MGKSGSLQIYYRGCLNFCNYTCSYCPFAKKPKSARNLWQDREQLERFIKQVEDLQISCSIQVIPYGEAMIQDYYWEALSRLSRLSRIVYVGVQSNFSFPVESFVKRLEDTHANVKKIRLWGTFHPEMTSVDRFVKQCRKLKEAGISFCVGAVAVPQYMETIQKLRKNLPKDIYLWLNKMDGAKKPYTEEEIKAFLEIDRYFEQEFCRTRADASDCGNTYFVQGNGGLQACPVSCDVIGNFYQLKSQEDFLELEKYRTCRRKYCNCYLAYNNRSGWEKILFGEYPAFRIPFPAKAVFFDIDGTLLKKGERKISTHTCHSLQRLAKIVPLYLATSRPLEEAKKVLGEAVPFFEGGVFACGAHVLLWDTKPEEKGQERFEKVYPLPKASMINWIESWKYTPRYKDVRARTYERKGKLYKITVVLGSDREACRFLESQRECILQIPNVRIYAEGRCVEVVREEADKRNGVEILCRELFLEPKQIAFCGDSKEDEELLGIVGFPQSFRQGFAGTP